MCLFLFFTPSIIKICKKEILNTFIYSVQIFDIIIARIAMEVQCSCCVAMTLIDVDVIHIIKINVFAIVIIWYLCIVNDNFAVIDVNVIPIVIINRHCHYLVSMQRHRSFRSYPCRFNPHCHYLVTKQRHR